ncbi:MAG: hypothetical protein ACMUJM_25535 [bacterium]
MSLALIHHQRSPASPRQAPHHCRWHNRAFANDTSPIRIPLVPPTPTSYA